MGCKPLPPAKSDDRTVIVGGIEFDLDHTGEFDELFMTNAHVHIERMNDTGFWIGIEKPGKPMLHVNTGVDKGVWFFNLFVDDVNSDARSFSVQRPRRSKVVKTCKPNQTAQKRPPEVTRG